MSPASDDRLPRLAALDLLACFAAFGLILLLGAVVTDVPAGLLVEEWGWGAAVAAITSFLGLTAAERPRGRRFVLRLNHVSQAAGITLLAQFALVYAFVIRPIPLQLTIPGVIASALAVASLRALASRAADVRAAGLLVVGFDSIARELVPVLREPVMGVLDSVPARVPPELPFLGDVALLARAAETHRPARVLLSDPACRSQIAPELLLNLRYSGVDVENATALFETTFRRVCWERLPPVSLLFSASTNANRAAMAIQAVYTNLIGLALLLFFMPLLIAVGVVITVCSGGGPVLERVECMGFLQIPFQMLRFRTPRAGRGLAAVGRALARLRLTNLPRIINVLRGEMVLFGPPPVRRAFAERMSELILVYPHRFTVKPGIFGWSQTNLRDTAAPADEALRLAYDLYYIKQNSPALDLEILARTIFPVRAFLKT